MSLLIPIAIILFYFTISILVDLLYSLYVDFVIELIFSKNIAFINIIDI